MERNLRNEYRHNSKFRIYADKYCAQRGITLSEALKQFKYIQCFY